MRLLEQRAPLSKGIVWKSNALVREACLKLADCDSPCADRAHFYAVAARAMRQIRLDRGPYEPTATNVAVAPSRASSKALTPSTTLLPRGFLKFTASGSPAFLSSAARTHHLPLPASSTPGRLCRFGHGLGNWLPPKYDCLWYAIASRPRGSPKFMPPTAPLFPSFGQDAFRDHRLTNKSKLCRIHHFANLTNHQLRFV